MGVLYTNNHGNFVLASQLKSFQQEILVLLVLYSRRLVKLTIHFYWQVGGWVGEKNKQNRRDIHVESKFKEEKSKSNFFA